MCKSDRELLELAAKAAGYDVVWNEHWQCYQHRNPVPDKFGSVRHQWTPLDDDGDAMRLRGKIGAWIADEGDAVRVEINRYPQSSVAIEVYERDLSGGFASNQSVCKATRRAIVSAAAQIGAQL